MLECGSHALDFTACQALSGCRLSFSCSAVLRSVALPIRPALPFLPMPPRNIGLTRMRLCRSIRPWISSSSRAPDHSGDLHSASGTFGPSPRYIDTGSLDRTGCPTDGHDCMRNRCEVHATAARDTSLVLREEAAMIQKRGSEYVMGYGLWVVGYPRLQRRIAAHGRSTFRRRLPVSVQTLQRHTG